MESVKQVVAIDVKELQEKMLEILLYFDEFCKENNLKYFLCGGCLIGAIRHQGFVPWDDDVDLFMPRPDYETLSKLWNEKADTSRYLFCRTNKTENYHDGGASVRDVNTTEINRHSVDEDICHGIALEIMPLDGCPKSKLKRAGQLYNAFIYSLFNVQRLPDNKGTAIRLLTKGAYKLIRSNEKRYKIWRRAEAKMTQYSWKECNEITELIGSIHGMLLRHPKQDFDTVVYRKFDKYEFPVMIGYERYLREIWGDYMQLPPVEKRVAKHDAVCIDLKNSYKKYRGVYYLVEENKDR